MAAAQERLRFVSFLVNVIDRDGEPGTRTFLYTDQGDPAIWHAFNPRVDTMADSREGNFVSVTLPENFKDMTDDQGALAAVILSKRFDEDPSLKSGTKATAAGIAAARDAIIAARKVPAEDRAALTKKLSGERAGLAPLGGGGASDSGDEGGESAPLTTAEKVGVVGVFILLGALTYSVLKK